MNIGEKGRLLADGVLLEVSRIVVETNEKNPVPIARITPNNIDVANGYRVRLKPMTEN